MTLFSPSHISSNFPTSGDVLKVECCEINAFFLCMAVRSMEIARISERHVRSRLSNPSLFHSLNNFI